MLRGASEGHKTGRTIFFSVIRVQKRCGLHWRCRRLRTFSNKRKKNVQ